MRYFYTINQIFRRLIWNGRPARIRLETLQRAKEEGGLAVPNPWVYFLAAQLQHLSGWEGERSNPQRRLLESFFQTNSLYESLEAHKFNSRVGSFPTLKLIHKIWWKIKEMQKIGGISQYTPLWHNPGFPDLFFLEGFGGWEEKG